jgi:hypothetical protein
MRRAAIFLLLGPLLGCGSVEGVGTPGGEARSFPDGSNGESDSLRVVDSPGGADFFGGADSLSLVDSFTVLDSLAPSSGTDSSAARPDNPVGVNRRFPKPEHVKGIYLNAWSAGSRKRSDALISLVTRTELNSVVIDIKDATGFISHATLLPMAREVGATEEIRIRDLPGLLARLEDAGIYPIARIVVAKDPLLSSGKPEFAIQDSAGGVWVDQDEVRWLNLHDKRVWDYHVDLAREVARVGFPEIQWDYVRFPDAPEALRARSVFPGAEGRTRTQAVRAFLGYSRKALSAEGVRVTADVFGVTTSYRKDVGIGQVWEEFIDQVDAALPMVYPSHYWTGSFGYTTPNAYPYEIVRKALRDAVSRSAEVEGAGVVRPWLQDFSLGPPPYGSPEIRAQIQATYDAGVEEWILWNPGSRYTESALMPRGKFPSWLEPVMRVGDQVVPVSKRFEVLGEVVPPGTGEPEDTIPLPEMIRPTASGVAGPKPLPAILLPDTGGVAGGGSGG